MAKTRALNASSGTAESHAAAFARAMVALPAWPKWVANGPGGFAWNAGLLRSAALWLIYTRQRLGLAGGHGGGAAIVWLPTQELVETAAIDLAAWQNACETDLDVHVFPPWDVLPTESLTPDSEALTGRSNVLRDIEEKRLSAQGIVLTSSQALLQPCPLARQGSAGERLLKKGDSADPIELIRWLTEKGYQRVTKTFAHGEAALRGHILDVYPWVRATREFDRDTAVRIVFEFDTIQEIHGFDPRTQRTLGEVATLRLADMSPERLAQPFDPRRPELRATFWEYLPIGTRLDWIDPDGCVAAARLYLQSQQPAEAVGPDAPAWQANGIAFSLGEVLAKVRSWPRAVYAPVGPGGVAEPAAATADGPVETAKTVPAADALIASQWPGEPELLEWRTTDLQRVQGGGVAKLKDLLTGERAPATVVIWADTAGDRDQLRRDLAALMPEQAEVLASRCRWLVGPQSQSFEFRGEKNSAEDNGNGGLVFVSQEHLQGKRHLRKADARRATLGKRLFDFLELNLGDLVVHTLHGICRYMGMTRMERNGKLEDYLVLLFADDVKMFVPGSHVDLVQKYVGKGGDAGRSTAEASVQLSRLGGRTWSTRKARAEKALKDIAEDLLAVQAARRNRIGIIHPPDNDMTRAFDAAFPYTETPDQLVSLADIKKDLERPYPMDRLLCGDVGFGKTEVAVRAAFKAVCGGRQVAVLVPTTILAEQHMKTFSERMKSQAVRVEALSRFRTPQEQKAILEDVKHGKVDVVIGTHRLLQKDVAFRHLGLVIIDEEQWFGVKHKERLKQLRTQVDVLTL
ncbi:MAG TPA: DEAD/DEAH box helicase, partial [Planctomycetota bacterium]|nr:DEAD/DEAH box helicase [Planctomycetota bacterium]